MKKMFLVLITVILLICFIGCKRDKAYDNIPAYSIIDKHDDGPMKIMEYDNLQIRYVDGWQNWKKIYELIDINYIDESEVVELGLDPSYYLNDNLKLMYRIYQYNYIYFSPETIDIYIDGTVVISYQDEERINQKYISVDKADLTKLKRQIDKYDNAIIEIDKESVEKISIYPFNNSINVVTDRDKINSLIEQFSGVVCDKCQDIDVSKKEYEIEVVTKDGEIYDIILNSDGSVGYYFNNEYYLSKKKNISLLYFTSVLKKSGTCSYVKSNNFYYGVGVSYDIWNDLFYTCEDPLCIDYIAYSENDSNVLMDIYYGDYGTLSSTPISSPYYPKNWEIYISIICENEKGNEIKEKIYKGGIAYLPKSQASCNYVNGRAIYGRSLMINIDIDEYILINDNFKNGKIRIEVSYDLYKRRESLETYLLYQINDGKIDLVASKLFG